MNRPLRAAQRLDRLAERRDPRPSVLRVEPGAGIQPLDLVQREIFEHPGAGTPDCSGPRPIGKDGFDVGRALERVVVQADDPAILRQLEIELDEGGALFRRHHEGGHGVLGCVQPRRRDAPPAREPAGRQAPATPSGDAEDS